MIAPDLAARPTSTTVRLPWVTWLEASLNGRLMGIVWSTPGATSSARSRTSSHVADHADHLLGLALDHVRAGAGGTPPVLTTADTSPGVASSHRSQISHFLA